MKKEDLINKWLNNDQLTKQESEAFEKLDVYDSYVKISETAKKFSAADYDTASNLKNLTKVLSNRKKMPQNKSYIKILTSVAAVFVIGIGLYFSFFKDYDTTIKTISDKSTFNLPDSSMVRLNATSTLTYNKKNWENERKVSLQGEAYFKVAKGKKFDVHTPSGLISVIGTRFNIKQRENLFEVVCYEGVVSVTIGDEIKYLRAGDALEYNSNTIKDKTVADKEPKWYYNKSYFFKTPFSRVIKELEWQYGVTLETKNIDPAILFTGNFVHSDIEIALKSITIPMRLKYVINDKTVTLYKE
ncbi:FecR family protein [Aquimarina amphilecti]|uniref:FecR family protein n=1 Tax=Aquimarina amphilecti TaxID=1038014 RepID=A0A1H7UJW1_AQUAM|nr:FecR family protein [Aquimarina amphilecti]SEL97099.1 FecR family protein [Aquimarina amphilecti]